jgi:hypothetical protein
MENTSDLQDFIDPDEGYRLTDWDSHLDPREPFACEALPCEACGAPLDCERHPASWAPELMVGPCCQIEDAELPDKPVCPGLFHALMHSDSVAAVSLAYSIHLAECPVCQVKRKDVLAGGVEIRRAA